MKLDNEEHVIKVGPGGRRCPCCAPPARILKKAEHRKARRMINSRIKKIVKDMDEND